MLALLGWLSHRYPVSIDMSTNQRNSLSAETTRLLEQVEHPIDITLFITPINERKAALEKRQHEEKARLAAAEHLRNNWPTF